MKSEEKQNSTKNSTNNDENNEMYKRTITQNNINKEKDLDNQNNQNYLSIFSNTNSIDKNFNLKKEKTDYKLKSNSTSKRKLPLLAYSSISFYDSLPPENSKVIGIDVLKQQIKKKLRDRELDLIFPQNI